MTILEMSREDFGPNIPDDQNTICAPIYVKVSVSSAEDRAVNMTG